MGRTAGCGDIFKRDLDLCPPHVMIRDEFAVGDSFAVVESVKAVSQIYTEAAGKVIEINEELDASPELLNSDPNGCFIAAIEFTNLNEDALLTADEYAEFLKSEE